MPLRSRRLFRAGRVGMSILRRSARSVAGATGTARRVRGEASGLRPKRTDPTLRRSGRRTARRVETRAAAAVAVPEGEGLLPVRSSSKRGARP